MLAGCSTGPEPAPSSSSGGLTASAHAKQESLESVQENSAALHEELRTGKAAPLPNRQPSASATSRCESSPVPSWVTQTVSLEGVGDSTVSQEDADKAARVAVIKQLEVNVTGEDSNITVEETGGKLSYRASSSVVEQVNLRISGLDIVKRYADACRSRFYALARLDQAQAVHAWQIDLRTFLNQRNERIRLMTDASSRPEFLAALAGWARLFTLDSTAAQLERRIEYLAPDQRPAESSARRVEQDRQEFNARLGALQLRKVSGDDQTAKAGRPLTQLLIARVVAALPAGDVAVSNVAVQFAFETGQGEVEGIGHTDAQGKVQVMVRSVAAGASYSTVAARVAIDQLGLDLSQALAQDVDRRMGTLVARFSMTPPPAFTEGSELGKLLHELARKLGKRVDQSQGSYAVMRGFLENRTQRRMSISSRIESSLSVGLTQDGIFKMIETVSPAAVMRSSSKEGNAPAVAVFGVYDMEADGSLRIEARVIRLSDQATEVDDEVSIPRSALPDADIRELSGLPQRPTQAPILQAPTPGESVSDWVESFWSLRNPAGFKTEMKVEDKPYQAKQPVTFQFRTTQDCYLNVVNIGAQGAWTMLLPNQYQSQTLIRASDGWREIPNRTDTFNIAFVSPFGTERIKVICTARPIPLVQGMDLSQMFFQISPTDGSKLRNMFVTPPVVRQEDWSEAHATIVTIEAGQYETRGMRSLRSRGLVSK